ncbi:MAG: 50S ribosomal protein L10 [Leptospiraceae bacterium]|nr:50S ribosomal protein L10 [Leptospiraceae bacterium]MCK6380121.1 50S ribosomal protein L10 [Leptospiraceae bacterium]NUM42758.1 50S ribosomal protein L10 [Leptospiraceae bacterium]
MNAEKKTQVAYLKERLEDKGNFILVSYSGLTVEDMEGLRRQFRSIGSELKVVKNNLFLRALKESSKHKERNIDFGESYKGPIAAVFSDEKLPEVAKVCKDFSKTNENLVVKAGFIDGELLDAKGVQSIAGLPSKEEILAQIAGGLNAPARSIAVGINQIMASLARGIRAVAEKNGK